MRNLVVDQGNSKTKIGLFNNSTLEQSLVLNSTQGLINILKEPHDNLIVSSVKGEADKWIELGKTQNTNIKLTPDTLLPITIKYSTPKTLGVDRIADACGAFNLFPGNHCLVIDLGTCINYESVDNLGNYWGGIISPGVKMRFQAMNNFTAQLPLVEPESNPKLIGDSTYACMQSGVMNGIAVEIDGIISQMNKRHPDLKVIMTGGDMPFFENQLKHSIFAAPELVLIGLNRILLHNVSK